MIKRIIILTEENPKEEIIIKMIKEKFNILYSNEPHLAPIMDSQRKFTKKYRLENICVEGINDVIVEFMRGTTKIVDYCLYEVSTSDDELPSFENIINGKFLVALEDTKTLSYESRNTSFTQRAGKFPILRAYYPEVSLIMNYNNECERVNKKFPNTSIFGYRLLLTMGVKVMGLESYNLPYTEFSSIEELFSCKNEILKGNKNYHNIPLSIESNDNFISMNVPLLTSTGKSHHIPNEGYLISMSYVIRHIFKDKRPIIVRNHRFIQSKFDKASSSSILYSMENLGDYTFEGINFDRSKLSLPDNYFKLDTESEKHVDIFLERVLRSYTGNNIVRYANHGGTEKTYYKGPNGFEPLKKESNGLPDLDIINVQYKKGVVIESKKWSSRTKGYKEIKGYDNTYKIKVNGDYPDYENTFWVTLNGENFEKLRKEMSIHKEILMGLSEDGDILLSENAPNFIKEAFYSYKVSYV